MQALDNRELWLLYHVNESLTCMEGRLLMEGGYKAGEMDEVIIAIIQEL